MNKKVIEIALNSALYLLNSEMESVSYEELKEEYSQVILNIEKALIEIENPLYGKA